MAVISKDLGAVTAYAAAVNRGYTGTKEEFETLMASYATVAQQAAESAQSAEQSAQSASGSATDAQTAQASAQGYAQSAQQSAQSASQYAQSAESAKDTAVDAVDGFASGAQQALESVNSAGINWKSLAQAKALDSEAWAVGKRGGEDVGAQDETYNNNAHWYALTAATDATTASNAAQTATTKAGEAAQSASQAAESARTLTIDATLTQSGQAADSKAVGDKFVEITDTYIPQNYAENVDASTVIVASPGLFDKVTVADNPNGGVDVTNTSGVNGKIGFALDDLPYSEGKTVDFIVELAGAVAPITVDVRTAMAAGTIGSVRITLTADESGKYTGSMNLALYPYATAGRLYLGYELRYNQRTPVNIKLTVIEHGETTKVIIKTDKIENIDFANLSDNLNDAISAVTGEKPTQYGGKQIATFNKGVAIGDSLTAGVFNHNEGGTNAYITNSAFSYPTKLKQLCGVDLTNLGNGGYASDQWWTAHQNDDLTGNQFAIVQLGVNDAIQYQGWTETSVTAFTNIINKLLTENNGIFVFVATIIPATSYQGASYDAVSEGIRTLVESINSDHVILLDMAEYGNTADEVGYNNGHLSALGYERLALDYIAYISYIIARNPVLFRNIQFIGTNFSYN